MPKAALALSVLAALVVGAFTVAIVAATDGGFSYTFDDAYIHLRLSEMMATGTYGIAPGHVESPSSSALWPFLLTPFAATWFHPFAPLVISTASLAGTLVLTFSTLRRTWVSSDAGLTLMVLAMALALNWFGLPFTGLEHSLQTLLTVACAAGLVVILQGGAAPWWFWAAAVVAQWVRYEGLGVTIAALVTAALLGHPRGAALALLGSLSGLAAFSGLLLLLGLPPLPGSVLAKSGQGPLTGLLAGNGLSGLSPELLAAGIAVATLALVCAYRSRSDATLRPWAVALAAATVSLGVHMLIAPTPFQLGRYSIAVLSFAALLAVAVLAVLWPALARSHGPALTAVALLAAAIITGSRLPVATIATVAAARGIHDQQGQLHSLVVNHLRSPVALNDLGWMSYRNPRPVVDLAGLGSRKAREARASGDPQWISRLVDPSEVPAAVIHADWFESAIPRSWVQVGTVTAANTVTNWRPTVEVFATSPAAVPLVCAALREFATELGPRTTVSLFESGPRPHC